MKKRIIRFICILLVLFTVMGVVSVHAEEQKRETAITSVRVSGDGDKLVISATLSDARLKMYKNLPIYLFEFYPCDKNADLAKKAPVSFAIAAEELTFELDMEGADPQRKYSKFIMATSKDALDYELFGNVAYIENPEALADGEANAVTAENPVGLALGMSGAELSDKFGHRVLPVYVNEMFADTADGSVPYRYGESVYYIDTDRLAQLDSRVKEYSEGGAAVYLQLLLSAPDVTNASLSYSLYSVTEGGQYFAPNTENPLGVRLWSSLVEFLCDRYCLQEGNGRVSAFVLGDNVNQKTNFVGGGENVQDFSAGLLRTLRVTEMAVRSTCRGVDTYISLGGEFAGSFEGAYAVKDIFAEMFKPESDAHKLSFGIYMDISSKTPAFWTDEEVRDDSTTPAITPKNLEYFVEYMSADEYLYDSRMRGLMFGYCTDGTVQNIQAASALCALYRVVNVSEAKAFIYKACTDSETDNRGLFSSEGLPKVVYSELCTAVESDMTDMPGRIKTLLGESEYESLRDSVLSDLFVVRGVLPVYTGDIPGEVDAIYLADFIDNSENLFEFDEGTATHGFTMDSTGNVLRLTAKKDSAGMGRTFDDYDLSDKSILVVELKAVTDDPTAALTVILSGKSGEGDVSLASVVDLSSGQWNELAFDVSSMDSLSQISLTVKSEQGGALSWYIKDITVYSGARGADALAVQIAVVVLIISIIIFIILLITLIYMRSRKRFVRRDRYTVSRRSPGQRRGEEAQSVPVNKAAEPPKSEPTIPVMPKTEPKTFVVPPKKEEAIKRQTMSLGIHPISADTIIEIDKTKGE